MFMNIFRSHITHKQTVPVITHRAALGKFYLEENRDRADY
jgi:hypothetical protein